MRLTPARRDAPWTRALRRQRAWARRYVVAGRRRSSADRPVGATRRSRGGEEAPCCEVRSGLRRPSVAGQKRGGRARGRTGGAERPSPPARASPSGRRGTTAGSIPASSRYGAEIRQSGSPSIARALRLAEEEPALLRERGRRGPRRPRQGRRAVPRVGRSRKPTTRSRSRQVMPRRSGRGHRDPRAPRPTFPSSRSRAGSTRRGSGRRGRKSWRRVR